MVPGVTLLSIAQCDSLQIVRVTCTKHEALNGVKQKFLAARSLFLWKVCR